MVEAELERVQRLPAEPDGPQDFRAVDVALLADQGVAAQPGLNPDLVAPPGPQPDLDQRRVAEGLDGAVVRDRLAAARDAQQVRR